MKRILMFLSTLLLIFGAAFLGNWILQWLVKHVIGGDLVRWLLAFSENNRALPGVFVTFVVFTMLTYMFLLIYNFFMNKATFTEQLEIGVLVLMYVGTLLSGTLVAIAILKWAWRTVFSGGV